jgi:citrate lyase subunit beta/citryl-CoA lyase
VSEHSSHAAHPPRTVLAIPGSSERFLRNATESCATVLMIDLEDGVAETHKPEARVRVREWLGQRDGPQHITWLRVTMWDLIT